ncbi:899_t:CDS:1 [Entrophospora sp. SA101]|nr:2397_t:CDS:1 [Entrophospora sp. SA101]CAJ0763245.1 899_t:CDS:1 [Entrophospora sp. SA101]CAJ0886801.1 4680_t:CDS:1 [Entrophospora sp. SA101]
MTANRPATAATPGVASGTGRTATAGTVGAARTARLTTTATAGAARTTRPTITATAGAARTARPTITATAGTVGAVRTARTATTAIVGLLGVARTARLTTNTTATAGTARTARTITTPAGVTRRRILKKRTNTEKNRAKKRRRKLRKLRQPRVAPSTKRVKIDDEFNEDVFKYISPISLIESIDLKLKPERYPRFMFKNQKKANTWSCQLKFLKKKWVSDNKPGKQPAKIDVCKKAIMELYKDTPELCVDVRNEMLKLNDRETDTMVTLFKNSQ